MNLSYLQNTTIFLYLENNSKCVVKFNKILVPLDGSKSSKKTLSESVAFAKQNDASLVGLYVLPFSPLSYRNVKFAQEIMYGEGKKILENAQKVADKAGVVLQPKILKGTPGELISTFANQNKNKIDLIMIGSRGMGGLKELFLGSVSHHVIHKSKKPVMIIK
jgi:nucleotide-binding universal stress UspA family protein